MFYARHHPDDEGRGRAWTDGHGGPVPHDLLLQISWSNAGLTHTFIGATEPYDSQGAGRFHFKRACAAACCNVSTSLGL
jgi:hypothetical protein